MPYMIGTVSIQLKKEGMFSIVHLHMCIWRQIIVDVYVWMQLYLRFRWLIPGVTLVPNI